MWLLAIVLAIAIMWWMHRLTQRVIKALVEYSVATEGVLNTLYPVFSLQRIRDVHARAVRASFESKQMEQALLDDPIFSDAAAKHKISDDLSDRMLKVCDSMVSAEKGWYIHASMMDANLAALNGKKSREEAYTVALQRIDSTNRPVLVDEYKLRDEWKSRLENPSAPPLDPSPRPYSNPWESNARRRGT